MKKLVFSVFLPAAFALSGCGSCDSYYTWRQMGPVPENIARKAFWSKECKEWAAPLRSRPASPSKLTAAGEFAVPCGPCTVSRTYPARDIIRLEKTTPEEVQLGVDFDYSIKVTNLTDMVVDDVVVTERIPTDFTFTGASPEARKDGSMLIWLLGALAPKASEELTVRGSATRSGCLTHYANVTYSVPACASVKVVQAKLQLVKTVPAEVLLCDPIPVSYEISNTGTGLASDVTLVDKLPDGLRTDDGKSELIFGVGALAADQTKQFKATLKASQAGRYANKAVANAALALTAESQETVTMVRQPVLTISLRGPRQQYLGRALTYEITVTNRGDGPAEHTAVETTIPPGVAAINASDGGNVFAAKALWELGTLAPNGSKTVSITYTGNSAADFSNSATATAYCAPKVTATAETSVVGIPAILLEVVDAEDPVEVGGQGTYVITATNQGSAPGTNIRIVCVLEDNADYVSSGGATAGTAEGGVVTFEPLSSLAPKDKATWRVTVKAVKAGHVLFKVSMTTEEFTRPIQETESTNLY